MDQTNKIGELILEKWIASLPSRDRSTKSGMPQNFDDLFLELKNAGLTFDEAHALLPKAIKAHLPKAAVRKNYWKANKALQATYPSEADFNKDWDESIKSCGTEAFFAHFPLKSNEDEDNEPKVYGNMSVKEYRLQRKYADNFPRLNTDELERQLRDRREGKTVDFDVEDVLGGNDDDK